MDAVISALFRLVEQEAQGLQVFAFSVVTVNAEHKDDICAELCLKLWFASDWKL